LVSSNSSLPPNVENFNNKTVIYEEGILVWTGTNKN
jgi:hypothetical protein